MTEAQRVIAGWLEGLPSDATFEHVYRDFWYVRIAGAARRWIPLEIAMGKRTVKLTSHVIIEPVQRQSDVYKFLLRHNHRADGVAFSFEGKEGVICLVARIPLSELDTEKLDLCVGRIVEATETTFRSILEMGFGSRLRKR